MGIPKKNPNIAYHFASYSKTKNGWRSLIQPSSISKNEKLIQCYKIHYFNNPKDNITGIFIESINGQDNKDGLNENSNISDKYNTTFTYIKSKDGLPIVQNIKVEDFPVPFRKRKIIKEYIGSYIYFGIVEHNITDDYYLKIDGKKFKLSD